MTTGGSNRPRRWRRSPSRSLWIPPPRMVGRILPVERSATWHLVGVMLAARRDLGFLSAGRGAVGCSCQRRTPTLPRASSSSARRYQRSARPRWILLDRARCGTRRALHAKPTSTSAPGSSFHCAWSAVPAQPPIDATNNHVAGGTFGSDGYRAVVVGSRCAAADFRRPLVPALLRQWRARSPPHRHRCCASGRLPGSRLISSTVPNSSDVLSRSPLMIQMRSVAIWSTSYFPRRWLIGICRQCSC